MIWLAIAACVVVIFAFGMAAGMVLLRAELRRNGWTLHLEVDEKLKT